MDKIIDFKTNNTIEITEDCNLFFTIDDSIKYTYSIKDCNCNMFVIVDVNNLSNIEENVSISNANVNIYYVELNNIDINMKSNISLYRNSNLKINTILIASDTKNIEFNISNVEDHSNCEIYNNVVGLDKAIFSLNVIGNILKKSPYSKCIQKTHCLSIGKPEKLKVLPILNIDNENVIAAHSLSSGTIDSKIMYYINSRGLDRNEAIKLVLKSYLSLPEDVTDRFKYANISDIFNRKVDALCLM